MTEPDLSHIGDRLEYICDALDQMLAVLHQVDDRIRCADAGLVSEQGPAKVTMRCGLTHGHPGVHRAGAWTWEPSA